MRYALLLNDMRQPNVENIEVVYIAATKQEVVDWYMSQTQAPWRDERWSKTFPKDSPLEWFNPAASLETENDFWGGVWRVDDGTSVGGSLYKDMPPKREPKRVAVTVRAACQSCPWTHDMPVGTIDAEPATIAISLDVYTGRVAQTHAKARGHHNFDFLASWEEYIEVLPG